MDAHAPHNHAHTYTLNIQAHKHHVLVIIVRSLNGVCGSRAGYPLAERKIEQYLHDAYEMYIV